jgi:hypothetical protein
LNIRKKVVFIIYGNKRIEKKKNKNTVVSI